MKFCIIVNIDWLLYLLPGLPLFFSCVPLMRHWNKRFACLDENGDQRESQRAQLLNLSGFAFLGLLALVVVDGALNKGLNFPIYYLLIGFLLYMSSLNVTRYWFYRAWHLLLSSTLMDAGTLCLLLCVSYIVRRFHPNAYGNILTGIAGLIWLADYVMNLATWRRTVIDWQGRTDVTRQAEKGKGSV